MRPAMRPQDQDAGARSSPAPPYDVAVIGGGLTGSATALLLKRAAPGLRVLLADERLQADRKVGESAIELSSWFLTRVLGLDRHLTLEQLPKYGLRYFFQNDAVTGLANASELGNRFQTRVPSYHVDRSILDDHVLGLAEKEGVEVLRGVRAIPGSIDPGRDTEIRLEGPDAPRDVLARWIVDATGRKAVLARKLELLEPVAGHPTRSVWARYRDVADIDSGMIPDRLQGGAGVPICSRGLSTNHLTGLGWWIWIIPLPGGETSVGIVWDERLFDLPPGGTLAARFDGFMRSTPAGREILQGASMVDNDLHALNHLPYRVRRLAGPGWALVGDASGFIDPLYSPGLDWGGVTVVKTVEFILRALRGEKVTGILATYNARMTRSFRRLVEALYLDKYYYLGDIDLMEIALRVDVGLYYFGVVAPPYREGVRALEPPFALPISTPFYHLMRVVNWRLAVLARSRLASGSWGRGNAGRRVLLPGFAPGPKALSVVPGALARLVGLELRTLAERLAGRRGAIAEAGARRGVVSHAGRAES